MSSDTPVITWVRDDDKWLITMTTIGSSKLSFGQSSDGHTTIVPYFFDTADIAKAVAEKRYGLTGEWVEVSSNDGIEQYDFVVSDQYPDNSWVWFENGEVNVIRLGDYNNLPENKKTNNSL